MKHRIVLTVFLTVLLLIIPNQNVFAADNTQSTPTQIKALNFVFLHGAGASASSMQPLMDGMVDRLPSYIADYEKNHPGIKIEFNCMDRSYPNNVDIATWSNNIADSINKYFHQDNLILIGHSMGGKAALYTTKNNVGNLQSQIAAVVTINSPIKKLSDYDFTGGTDYWRGALLVPQDKGVIGSLAYYDSSDDGEWVGTNKHWLALTSAESSPMSPQFDVAGVDPLPRDMDDTIVPISAQYADGADVYYYGEHSHSEFSQKPELAGDMADYILNYLFGGVTECSVQYLSGDFSHQAGWMPVTNGFNEITGENTITSGSYKFYNPSFTHWQDWNLVVGDSNITGARGNFQVTAHSLPVVSGLLSSSWLNGDSTDSRVSFRIRAAPRTSVVVEWVITGYQDARFTRDRYEVQIDDGTPFTNITGVSWASTDPGDFRLKITSSAEGPLRWFQASWRVYYHEPRVRDVVEEMMTGTTTH